MRNNVSFLIGINLLFFSSCNVEQTIFFDDVHEEQLAVIAILNTKDTLHRVFLTNTISSTAIPKYDTIRNAEVVLEGADRTYDFLYNDESGYYEYSSTLPFEVGQVWWLTVSTPNFDAIEVSQTVPSLPTDIVVDTSNLERTAESFVVNSDGLIDFPLSFMDVQDSDNYYILEILGTGVSSYFLNGEILFRAVEADSRVYSDSPDVEYSVGGRVYLTDRNRDGDRIALDLEFGAFLDTLHVADIRLLSTTREHYLYSSSTSRYNSTGAFSEPVTLYSNIENGAGIFSLQQVYSLKVNR